MIKFISKILNTSKKKPEKGDDFSYFFLEAKSREKAQVIKQIMKEATEEQENVLRKYNESKLIGV
jgi:hypothetical protein